MILSINYPAASSGVCGSISHSGLDPESSVSFLDSRFRGNDEKRGKPRGMYPKGFNQIMHLIEIIGCKVIAEWQLQNSRKILFLR
jgi:hypothetical protein